MFTKFMRLIYPNVELSFFFLQIALSHKKRNKDIKVAKKKATRLSEMLRRQKNITEKETRESSKPILI